ncbi:MAG: carboxymuconolactone decarboxylase family protein [Acidimicrobiales bacterium]
MTAPRPAPTGLLRQTGGSAHHSDRLLHLPDDEAGITGPPVGEAHSKAHSVDLRGLDARTAALARLAALVALRAAPESYRRGVDVALAAGASIDEVVDTLRVVARIVGLPHIVSAAPGLALALGYDIELALETLDDPGAGDTRGPVRAVADP